MAGHLIDQVSDRLSEQDVDLDQELESVQDQDSGHIMELDREMQGVQQDEEVGSNDRQGHSFHASHPAHDVSSAPSWHPNASTSSLSKAHSDFADQIEYIDRMVASIKLDDQVLNLLIKDDVNPLEHLAAMQHRLKSLKTTRAGLRSRIFNTKMNLRALIAPLNVPNLFVNPDRVRDALEQVVNIEKKFMSRLEEGISYVSDFVSGMETDLEITPVNLANANPIKGAAARLSSGSHVHWSSQTDNEEFLLIHAHLKEDLIPLVKGTTTTVDYSKLKLLKSSGHPELTLDLAKVDPDDTMKVLAKKVKTFLEAFRSHYEGLLPGLLFDKLAWAHMPRSLVKVERATRDFEGKIKAIPLDKRSWDEVVKCVYKTLDFDKIQVDIVSELLKTDLRRGESLAEFSDRIMPLIEAVKVPEQACGLIAGKISFSLSDVGYQATVKKYGSFMKVNDIKEYLEHLQTVPGAWPGARTNHAEVMLKRFGGKIPDKTMNKDKSSNGTHVSHKSHNNGKRSRPSAPKPEWHEVCTYSENCKAKGLKHPKDKCFAFQADERKRKNGPSTNDRNDHNGRGQFKKYKSNGDSVKSINAFSVINDRVQYGSLSPPVNKDETMIVKSYFPCPKVSNKLLRKWLPYQCNHGVNSFRGPAPGDNRVAVPIHIMGKKHTALLDPGATISVIAFEAANNLNIRYGKQKDAKIALVQKGSVAASIVTCETLQLQCNGKSVERSVYVMDIEYYDFIIGMDLFSRFGYAITGVVMPENDQEEFAWVPTDEKPPVIPRVKPAKELTKEFKNDKSKFMAAIESHLKTNEAIDPKSCCTIPSMRVKLNVKPDCVIQERSRPFHAQVEKKEVDSTVQKWWDSGVIVLAPPGNPYNSSLTMAARRDLEGNIMKYRVCLDPRRLNKQLLDTDNFPLPLITDIIEKVSGHKYFSTVDLSQAYHRMPVDPKSQPLTAFSYGGKQYMFARAPFGLKPLTSIFQRGMSRLLGDLPYVGIYVDDIIIFSKTKEDHLVHVQVVLERLTEAKLIVNREKSHFMSTEVLLLGFIVNEFGKKINYEKLANVHLWAYPTNKKMIQRYLGLFNYFRIFIPLYSTITAPLDRLRNARGTFVLNDIQKKCFDSIRNLIAQAPVLSFPDFSLRFYVATDASNVGIGIVLYQLPNGESDPTTVNYISFQARSLHKHERNYPAYKKELLGIIFALMKFHHYLWGRKFTLYTDHRPLTYLHEQKELPQILTNWKETLFNYDFDCIYRPGLLNVIPDALSRAFPDELWTSPEFYELSSSITRTVAGASRSGFRRIEDLPNSEPDNGPAFVLSNQMSDVTGEPIATYLHVMQDDETSRDNVLDAEERKTLLKQIHEFGHLGGNAMVKAIHEQGKTWPKLREDCLKWVSQCRQCQQFNIARKGYHPLKAIHATLPGEHIAIDLATFRTSLDGNIFALVMVDVCTRFVFLRALKNKEAVTVADELFQIFCMIGFPKIIQSDNGSEFVNQVSKRMSEKLKIDHRLSTPYHPRSNGVAERFVRSLKENIQKQLEGQEHDWDKHLPMTQLQLNTRAAGLHGSTPFSLFFGRSFAGLTDFSSSESHLMSEDQLRERLEYLTKLVYPAISEKSADTQRKMIEKFNRTHRILEFPPGSFVMARDPLPDGKLSPKYHGPYKIVERTVNGSYTLADATNSQVHRNYAPEQLKIVTQALDAPSDESYEVESILAHDLTAEGVVYTVKWKGYDSSENSQLAYEEFDTQQVITDYWKKQNQANPHISAKRVAKAKRAEKKLQKMKELDNKPILNAATPLGKRSPRRYPTRNRKSA